jgi:dipeptidyl-peptidase 4
MRAIMSRRAFGTIASLSLAAVLGASVFAQQRPALTADDYARAERFLAPAVTPLVVGGSVTATWLADDRFWYRNALAAGAEFIIVDPVKRTRVRAFNHERIAAALSAATGSKHEPLNLAIQGLGGEG